MTLFANQKEANLESTIAMIEEVLVERGHVLETCRRQVDDAAAAWRLRWGSASVDLVLTSEKDRWWLTARSVLMTITEPVDRPALFAHLLRQNIHHLGAAFAVEDDRVLLVSQRSTLDLDRSEVLQLVSRIEVYADQQDDALVERFGGTRGVDDGSSS